MVRAAASALSVSYTVARPGWSASSDGNAGASHRTAHVPTNDVAFVTFDDAYRYKTLLEANMDSYSPYIQYASRFELDHACSVGGYHCRVVNKGALITPPMRTVKLTDWEIRQSLLDGNWSVAPKPGNHRE